MNKQVISEAFTMPHEAIRMTGIDPGVLLRFETFYLKVYDNDRGYPTYRIYGYRYNERNAIFMADVAYYKLREFGKLFTDEDYLAHHPKSIHDECYL